jgi:tRNA (mo5U34)-methyltransferase
MSNSKHVDEHDPQTLNPGKMESRGITSFSCILTRFISNFRLRWDVGQGRQEGTISSTSLFVLGTSHGRMSTIAGRDEIQERITALGPWFHNISLGGVYTAPNHFLGDYPEVKYRHFRQALPTDLTGKRVLDIGCNAGFYSLEMKRRGAERVLGIDTDERYLRQARFAAEISELKIEFRRMAVWDVAALKERFDVVIFMGVLYHLRHPLLALDLIHEHVAEDLLVFQSMMRGSDEIAEVAEDYDFNAPALFDEPGYPKMHFVEHRYSHDETNWWVPNRAGVEAMLRSSGFEIESQPEAEVYFCRWRPVAPAPDGPRSVYPARPAAD